MPDKNKQKFYLVGGGIASLATAVYLINYGKVNGKDITIFEGTKKIGGCLDAKDSHGKRGYIMRGIRMFEDKAFSSTFDLMSKIPSLNKSGETLREEFIEYNKKHKIYCEGRLVKNGEKVDGRKLGLNIKDKYNLLKLLFSKESNIQGIKIGDFFTSNFFETNFWYELSTIFGFQPWHSLIEYKRYMLRFIHTLKYFYTLEPVELTPYNQYESMVLPIKEWLKSKGVNFSKETIITDIEFKEENNIKIPNKIFIIKNEKSGEIKINKEDKIFVTLGSIVADTSNGSMNEIAKLDLENTKKHIAWELWEKLAEKNNFFGKPKVFDSDIKKTQWMSFTITFNDSIFFKLMKKFVDKKVTSHGGVTLIDSNWFISLVLFVRPYFQDQKKEIKLSWGDALYPDREGNFVKKKMSECTGKEILTEIIYHLKFEDHLDEILKNAVCIPTILPYITSHFLPRKSGDRPKIIPENTKNFAFLGQFCEIPDDIVFTVEYSIRSAQIAVNSLLNLDKLPTPIYKGIYNPKVFYNAVKVIMR